MPEKIDCVAIRLPNKSYTYVMTKPNRHGNIIQLMTERGETIETIANSEEGFTTTEGRFVSRKEALRIAEKAGQVIGEIIGNELYSENLWTNHIISNESPEIFTK